MSTLSAHRWSMAPLVAGSCGIVIGTVLGDSLHFTTGAPDAGGPLPAALVEAIGVIGFVAILFVVAGVLLVRGSTRRGGLSSLILAATVIPGLALGFAFGRSYLPARDLAGEVTVAFDAPMVSSLTSAATCRTVANGDRIVTVRAAQVGDIGGDQLGVVVRLEPAPTVDLLLHRVLAYQGTGGALDAAADRRTGSLTLADMATASGGTRNSLSGGRIAGHITWGCSDVLASAPPATAAPLHGYLTLTGVFATAELPIAGECDATQDVGVGTIEAVVPWARGQQARLDLVARHDSATLTIDLVDGTTAESATSPARVVEHPAETGVVTSRSISATFYLSGGLVQLHAEWQCPVAAQLPGPD